MRFLELWGILFFVIMMITARINFRELYKKDNGYYPDASEPQLWFAASLFVSFVIASPIALGYLLWHSF